MTAGSFLLGTALAATRQITYAPYVADYSRHLPERTSIKGAYWYTYAGSVLASCWMMAFGALAAAAAPGAFDGGSVEFIVHQSHHLLALVWADGGYTGSLVEYCLATLALVLAIVKRSDDQKGSSAACGGACTRAV